MELPNSGPAPTSVLFVCLGNICRSPLAEGVFRHLVVERGLAHAFRIESAGTGGWHVGEAPDGRASVVAANHGIVLESRAQQVTAGDLQDFDIVLAMDRENLRSLQRLDEAQGGGASIHLLREFDPRTEDGDEVPDPYYGGPSGFENVYQMVRRSCEGLLRHLQATTRVG